MMDIVNEYYKNDAKKLHIVVDNILRKYGGIFDKDRDDFYSLANEVFVTTLRDFDESKCNFDGFLYSNLSRKIITEIRDRNIEKRSNTKVIKTEDGKVEYQFMPDVSTEMPIPGSEKSTVGDSIADEYDLEKEIIEEKREEYSDKMSAYLERLSVIQRKILEMLAIGYIGSEIAEGLHISNKEYLDAVAGIYSYRNISVLI